MSVVADFTIAAEGFSLGRLLTSNRTIRIELERLVPTGNEVMPYFWAKDGGDALEEFERAVDADPLVNRIEAIDELDGETLYAIEWEREPESLIQGITQSGGAILSGRGTDGHWRFMLRFPDHTHLSEFSEFLTAHDIDIQVDRVYTQTAQNRGEFTFDVTDEQREALVSAVRGGYFEVPRGVTLTDLAEELGITRQATSERVRRGANTVLRKVLLESYDDTAPDNTDEETTLDDASSEEIE